MKEQSVICTVASQYYHFQISIHIVPLQKESPQRQKKANFTLLVKQNDSVMPQLAIHHKTKICARTNAGSPH
jgi:hypothetical protein